jgi:glycine hydroxymethyltransferase
MNECLNLIPSENVTSNAVRELLASDLGHRYTLTVNSILHGVLIKNAYGGTKFTDQIEQEAEEITKKVFNTNFCTLKPLSGHVAGIIMLAALCNPKDRIMTIHAKHGGYDGYLQEYIPNLLGLDVDYLPFNEVDWNVDFEAAASEIRKIKPKLVIIGTSFILFPYKIKELRDACSDTGAILGYDASHVLGLIAGGEFQKPFQEGVDIITGSTHKSFFGPQGGLILTNREDIYKKVSNKLAWHTIDNPHQNRIAALGQTMLEFKEFGGDYAKQVIKNSKALSHALVNADLPVRFGHRDYTESHQVLLDINKIESEIGLNPKQLLNQLENENIIIDAIGRLGTNEMTRRGCKEENMKQIAEFITRILVKNEKMVKKDIAEFLKKCQISYCFD